MTQNIYQERVKEISHRKIEQAIQRAKKTNPAAGAELEAYAQKMGAACKIKTLENYVNGLAKIITDTKKPLSSLDNAALRDYFEAIKDMSNGTKYNRWQSLRSFFCDYHNYHRQIGEDLRSRWETLMTNIKRPGASKRHLSRNDHLKTEEIDKLLNACRNPRDKAFIMVLLESGARLGEILSMEVKDINFQSNPVEVKIEHSKTEDKAGKRSVYLFRAAPLLRAWIDAHPLNTNGRAFLESNAPVWVRVNGEPEPIVPNTANRILELVKKRAGMENRKLYAHLFRHTRASDLKDVYGLDVREIQDWLGHTRIDTTSGYLTADKTRILQKLSGETDKDLERRRQEAIAKGQPVPCPCGVSNDPEATFCYRCGRVVNKEHIEHQASELAQLKEQLADLPRMVKEIMRKATKEQIEASVKRKEAQR